MMRMMYLSVHYPGDPMPTQTVPTIERPPSGEPDASPIAHLARRAPMIDRAYLDGILGDDDPDVVIRSWARLVDEDEPTGTAGRH